MTEPIPDVTWPMLLSKWTEFARSAIALPKTDEGERWRACVPAIIGLQAVTHALGEIDRLSSARRAAGLDTAAVIIRKHAAELHAPWRGEPMPAELDEIISDARAALAAAQGSGLEWRVGGERLIVEHPADLLAALAESGFAGDLYLPTPGIPVFRGAPCGFCAAPVGVDLDVIEAVGEFLGPDAGGPDRVPGLRQVYRQFDFAKGGPVRDVVMAFEGGLPAGQPVLVPAFLAGVPQAVTLPPRKGAADVDIVLPVVFERPGSNP